ncbi:26S proteasome non-ATPase regulatory subunit 9 [Dermatophagoides pteronyssinus]|uniref:26S proteasome non-ATPase regulatory subunit 9 n=1 Tax=Dermatophagoides pteronyssinus TaxID=6956 RepID=UPI003F672513
MSSNCDQQQQQQHDRGDEHQNGHQKTRFEVRNEALELNRKRNQLENEIKDFMAILQSQGVGMTESLVDSEGFPRNDIDINLIRTARNRIICLQNDLRALMSQIEDRLTDYFVAPTNNE